MKHKLEEYVVAFVEHGDRECFSSENSDRFIKFDVSLLQC